MGRLKRGPGGTARRLLEVLRRRGIRDERVLEAFARIPRDRFVPSAWEPQSWEDRALPIGEGQTISQPSTVARTLELLALHGDETVLEVGAGSGYQAALLSVLARRVITVERIPKLVLMARSNLEALGIHNVMVTGGDGGAGYPAEAPYDAIVSAAASPEIPQPLLEQLGDGGRMVLPMGDRMEQRLYLVRREGKRFTEHMDDPCRFVPLIGNHGFAEEPR